MRAKHPIWGSAGRCSGRVLLGKSEIVVSLRPVRRARAAAVVRPLSMASLTIRRDSARPSLVMLSMADSETKFLRESSTRRSKISAMCSNDSSGIISPPPGRILEPSPEGIGLSQGRNLGGVGQSAKVNRRDARTGFGDAGNTFRGVFKAGDDGLQ